MRVEQFRGSVRVLFLVGVVLAATSSESLAQWTPLHVGNTTAIIDEFGKNLQGNSPAASAFGHTHVEGDIIQVLSAEYGVFPPNVDGTAHFANQVLFTGRIGEGIAGSQIDPAKFASSVTPRPNDQTIFVRVFNAASLEDASFYTDSQTHFVSKLSESKLLINSTKTDQPLDTNDDDGDGLHNSWEKSYGSDSNDSDSDDDGISDYEEHLAGTDPVDGDSKFVVARLSATAGQLSLEWDSVATKTYIVECSTNPTLDTSSYTPVTTNLTASSTLTQYPITNALENVQAYYRVRLVTE